MSGPLSANRWLFDNGTTVVNAVIGSILTTTGAIQTTSTSIPLDDTIPTSSEGVELTGLATTYTPKAINNRLRVTVRLYLSSDGVDSVVSCLFKDSGSSALAVSGGAVSGLSRLTSIVYRYEEVVTSLSAITFKVRLGVASTTPGTITLNGVAGVRVFGGKATSSVLVEEIQA